MYIYIYIIYIFKLELQPQVKDSSHFCTTSSGWNPWYRVPPSAPGLRHSTRLSSTCLHLLHVWMGDLFHCQRAAGTILDRSRSPLFRDINMCQEIVGLGSVFQNPGLPLGFTAAICQLPATPERSGSFTESPLPPLFRFLSAFSPWPLFGVQGGLTDMILRLAGLQQNMRRMNLCNPGIFFILKTKDNYSIGNNRKCCDI